MYNNLLKLGKITLSKPLMNRDVNATRQWSHRWNCSFWPQDQLLRISGVTGFHASDRECLKRCQKTPVSWLWQVFSICPQIWSDPGTMFAFIPLSMSSTLVHCISKSSLVGDTGVSQAFSFYLSHVWPDCSNCSRITWGSPACSQRLQYQYVKMLSGYYLGGQSVFQYLSVQTSPALLSFKSFSTFSLNPLFYFSLFSLCFSIQYWPELTRVSFLRVVMDGTPWQLFC